MDIGGWGPIRSVENSPQNLPPPQIFESLKFPQTYPSKNDYEIIILQYSKIPPWEAYPPQGDYPPHSNPLLLQPDEPIIELNDYGRWFF